MTTNGSSGQPSLTGLAALVDAAAAPLERLTALRELLDAADLVARETVRAAREAHASWTAVGEALSVSKQAAAKRYADRPEPVDRVEQMLAEPRVKRIGYVVTTPRGRTLLRIRKQ